MNTIWDHDGIVVVLTGATVDPDPGFTGIVTDDTRAGMWVWNAIPKPNGFYMTYRRPGATIQGSWTSTTWNLGLEIAVGFAQVVGRLRNR